MRAGKNRPWRKADVKAVACDPPSGAGGLCDYFRHRYLSGGLFDVGAEYQAVYENWTFRHQETDIEVWQDALDFRGGSPEFELLFHYTTSMGFVSITSAKKDAAEIWASLVTEGEEANEWWGKGVYTVPYPPDHWRDKDKLLDNNFRSNICRDKQAEERGEIKRGVVSRTYPLRVSFCLPLLVPPSSAFDVSERRTPEMEAKGNPPGTSLAGKPLNESGKPTRCCTVVCIDQGAEGAVENARSQLVETLRKRARAISSLLGEDDPRALLAVARLGRALQGRGLGDEALQLLQDALARGEHAQGPDHLSTLNSMSGLASLLQDQGRLKEAEQLYLRALDGEERAHGPVHPRALICVSNLARLLQGQGRLSEAEPLYWRALYSGEHALGPQHHYTMTIVSNLALLLQDQGRLDEAEPLQRRALEGWEQGLGPRHPSALTSANSFALLRKAQGRFKEAEELHRRALEGMEGALGPDHGRTLICVNGLAQLLQDRGRLDEAEPLYRRTLDACDRALGPDHPATMASINSLALLLRAQGRVDEAAQLYRRVVAGMERKLGPDSPSTLTSFRNLAALLEKMGALGEAEELLVRELRGKERLHGPEHEETRASRDNLERVRQLARRKEPQASGTDGCCCVS